MGGIVKDDGVWEEERSEEVIQVTREGRERAVVE